MERLLNNMRDITANKKPTAEEQLNSISGLQIQFDKLKKETGFLSGTMPPQVALEAPPAALTVQPKVLADKGIGPEIEPEEKSKKSYIKMYWMKKINQIRLALCHLKWQ